jgi:MoaA/NifB/PqqE/SkfB family radical SAM enzyme
MYFGVKGIILTGGGEPTLNPDFNKITEYLEKNEIDYGINTNFCEYRYFRPNYLKVSLDGYDRESYIKKRGVDRYDDVIANIKKYVENKDKSKTNLGVQMVVTDINDIEPFYNSVKDIDLDYIVYRPVESTNRCYYSDTDLKTFVPIFIKYLNSFKRKDERIVVNSKWGQLDQRFRTCVANWAQIALDECGNVIYCCHKPYEIVGHIMDDDIMEKREAFKTNMCTCDIPCRLTASNMLVEYAEQRTKDDCFI